MSLWVHISAGAEPIYLQIAGQIYDAVRKGILGAGDSLPDINTLAAKIVVNPNVVGRAYEILQQQGLITVKQDGQRVILQSSLSPGHSFSRQMLTENIDQLIRQADNLGLSPDEIGTLFSSRLKMSTNTPSPKEP
jgi:GntR family transcriptional regulator